VAEASYQVADERDVSIIDFTPKEDNNIWTVEFVLLNIVVPVLGLLLIFLLGLIVYLKKKKVVVGVLQLEIEQASLKDNQDYQPFSSAPNKKKTPWNV
jgi:hypothetical protein